MILQEAIRTKDFAKAAQLVASYIKKNVGKVYYFPSPERFASAGVKGAGIRLFLANGSAVRLNWKAANSIGSSVDLVSMDYWDGKATPQPTPTRHVKFATGQSLVKILPFVVDFLKGKITSKEGIWVSDKVGLHEMAYVTDFRQSTLQEAVYTSGEIHGTISKVIHAFEQGVQIKDQYKIGAKTYGPRWAQVVDTIKDIHADLFQKQGAAKILPKENVKKIDVKRVLALVTQDSPDAVGFTVTAGASETVEVDGAEEEDIERLTYEEQLDSLKTGMKLLLSNATNAILLGGRGGCLPADTLINFESGSFTLGQVRDKFLPAGEDIELKKFYDITALGLKIETRNGFVPATHMVAKEGYKATVEFTDGSSMNCHHRHFFSTTKGAYQACDLRISDEVLTKDGSLQVKNVTVFSDEERVFYDISVDSEDQLYLTANGIEHHNTGKTQTVEDVLHAAGKTDGSGYTKVTGSATPAGIYRILFQNKKGILLFDDSDSALNDQDGRNLFKAATDTKKVRKISWMKGGKNYVDPADYDEEDEDGDVLPRSFEFTGKVIFISNLSLNKLDPDGAFRTRAYVINIDPSNTEIYDFMDKICTKIPLDVNYALSDADRREVVALLKKRKIAEKTANLRTLVRALNTRAGVEQQGGTTEEWTRFVLRFA